MDQLAHVSFDLLGATPQTGLYLSSSSGDLLAAVQADLLGLRTFRHGLDTHLADSTLAAASPQVHQELEALRLLSLQLERELSDLERTTRWALLKGESVERGRLLALARHPSLQQIRQHRARIAQLHDSLDAGHEQNVAAQRTATQLGALTWISVLLTAWVVGLGLTLQTSARIARPVTKLERLMRQPTDQPDVDPRDPLFRDAPSEIASLSQSFFRLQQEIKQLLSQLEEQLRTDGLTAVGNRRHFDAMFEQEWKRGIRSNSPLSLLLLDVDHFKLFNDHYGHIEGDHCLKRIAQAILGQARRSSDLVCRIGGEEFAVLLPETAPAEALGVAQGIVRAIDALAIPHAGSQVATWVTASIGVASCTPDGSQRRDDLMERADQALYTRKKKQGRHGVTADAR